jgi:asparagine synthase (glutamine-hydrolysing)
MCIFLLPGKLPLGWRFQHLTPMNNSRLTSTRQSAPQGSIEESRFCSFLIHIGLTCSGPPFVSRIPGCRRPLLDSGAVCIWHAGFIANRAELIGEMDLPKEADDSEILLGLYRLYGNAMVSSIAGPFAWVLWDSRHRALLAARDRMGSQGLYYSVQGRYLFLSNRIGLILDALPSRGSLNIRSLVAHVNGHNPLPGETFHDQVSAVEPGVIFHVKDGKLFSSRYWRINPQPMLRLPSDTDYADSYRALLQKVVKEYLPCGPSGITLSGGLDSTSIAATVQLVSKRAELTAFCWVAPELPEADESHYSSAVSRHLRLPTVTIRADHCWTLCNPEGIHHSREFPSWWFYNELWDATYSRMREHQIDTAFTGVSGDNLFGGNVPAYADMLLTGSWAQVVRQIRLHYQQYEVTIPSLLRSQVISPLIHPYIPFFKLRSLKPVPWLGKIYRECFRQWFFRPEETVWMLPGRMIRLKVLRDPYLPHVLERSNLQSAEFGIELRHPLLDHRLIEFAGSLPTTQTFRAGQNKIIMRNAMRGILPDLVLDMLGKIYPIAIAHRGLREHEQAKVWSLISNMRSAELGLIDERRLQEYYGAYLAGKHDHEHFWYAVTLEDWLRRYF